MKTRPLPPGPTLALSLALAFALAGALSSPASARADWLNWRGPTLDGNAGPNAHPPTRFSEDKNLAWKIDLPGEGSSTPLVIGDQVIVLASEPAANGAYRFLLCSYSLEDGSENWRSVATETVPHEGMHATNTLASWSPVSDGQHIWAYYGSWGVHCFDLEGRKLWEKQLGPLTMRNGFGEGASPALHGDTLVLPRDHEGPSELVALDKATGDVKWRTPRDEPTNWGTPLITEHEGKAIVVTTGENFVRAHDLADGAELWRCAGQTMRPVATPLRFADSVIVASGFRGSYLCSIPLGLTGDLTDQVNYYYDGGTPDLASPLLVEDRLYFTQGKSAMLSCIDAATGEQHYFRERVEGPRTLYASPIAAAGHLYLTGREGTISVIKEGSDLVPVSINPLDATLDATPVAVGKNLLVRARTKLYCFRE